jgi:hypothetical protein
MQDLKIVMALSLRYIWNHIWGYTFQIIISIETIA